ncbi:hypothetical protein [Wolbachia endosymbiont of Pentalonia nigronervosa]|nr:hypothetical protein [Wolbachia endosymbiont of Pentalonia nigronervosa]
MLIGRNTYQIFSLGSPGVCRLDLLQNRFMTRNVLGETQASTAGCI